MNRLRKWGACFCMAAYLTGLGLADGAELGGGSETSGETDPTGNDEPSALSVQPTKDYTWGILGIAGVELATSKKGNAHGTEIIGVDRSRLGNDQEVSRASGGKTC